MFNLKLARKFLVLAVMVGGLFMATSLNRVSAIPCCSDCQEAYDACRDSCANPNPGKQQECIQRECDIPLYLDCFLDCTPTC